jgi:AraC-like DNA-binding protein
MSIQEIAQAVGMDDSSYFIRLFKKQIGFTPQEYRKRLIG